MTMTVDTEARARGAEASTPRVDLEPAPSTAQVHLLDSKGDREWTGRMPEGTCNILARVGFVGNPAAEVDLTAEGTVITGAKVFTAPGARTAAGTVVEADF